MLMNYGVMIYCRSHQQDDRPVMTLYETTENLRDKLFYKPNIKMVILTLDISHSQDASDHQDYHI